MKTMKKALALMLALVLVMGTANVGLGELFTPKAAAAVPANANGQFRVRADGTFTILQVTDLHSFVGFDDGRIQVIKHAIQNADPDLIILTGDNILGAKTDGGAGRGNIAGGTGTGSDEAVFKISLETLVKEFHDEEGNKIPFAMTFGNHDNQVSPSDNALKYSFAVQTLGAVDYQDTAYGTGTGKIEVYDANGSSVVDTVLIVNSGSKDVDRTDENTPGYGKPGYDVDGTHHDDRYNSIVDYVDDVTSSGSKVIAFQHIPLQEFYLAEGILEKTSSGGRAAYYTNNPQITGNYKAASGTLGGYTNANGETIDAYSETCCCSYGSTRDLYEAYAKPNTLGVFYGHDHRNTLMGKGTCYGKELVQGYGGGLQDGYPVCSSYTIKGDKLTRVLHTSKSYSYPADNMYANQTYIKEIGVYSSTTSLAQAQTECTNAGFTPISTFYNDLAAADLNAGLGSGATHTVIGYKTTTNPAEAIRDIRGTEMVDPQTSGVTYEKNGASYTLATSNYKNGNLNADAVVEGASNNPPVYLYYSKDEKAGEPITAISLVEGNGNSNKALGTNDVTNWLNDFQPFKVVSNFRENNDSKGSTVAWGSGTTKWNYAANLNAYTSGKRIFMAFKTATVAKQSPISTLPPDTDTSLAVPETIYLSPAASATTFQHYLNNTAAGAAKPGCDGSGEFEFTNEGFANKAITITLSGGNIKGSITTGTRNSNDFSSTATSSITVTADSNGKISGTITNGTCTAVATGKTGLITWTFSDNYSGKEIAKAYTVTYAPYISPVGAAAFSENDYPNSDSNQPYASHLSWWVGVHGYDGTLHRTAFSRSDGTDGVYYGGQASNKKFQPIFGDSYIDSPSNNDPLSYLSAPAVDGYDQSMRYYRYKAGNDGEKWTTTTCTAYTSLLTVDSSRFSNLNQIPNLKVGMLISDLANANSRRSMKIWEYTGSTYYYGYSYSSDTHTNLTFEGKALDSSHIMIMQSGPSNDMCTGQTVNSTSEVSEGLKYSAAFNKDFGLNYVGDITTCLKTNVNSARESSGLFQRNAHAASVCYCPIKVTCFDKSDLRSSVSADVKCKDYYSSGWDNYVDKLEAACKVLGNPTATSAQVSAAKTNLDNARDALTHTNITSVTSTYAVALNGGDSESFGTSSLPSSGTISIPVGSSTTTVNVSGWTVPARTGYNFLGWSTTKTTNQSTSTVTVGCNDIIYAVWQPKDIYIKYNSRGATGGTTGTVATSAGVVELGKFTYDEFAKLDKNGYEKEVTVTYNANGGTCKASDTVEFTFNGWNNRSSSPTDGTSYADEQRIVNYTDKSNDGSYATPYNLYAKWIETSVTLPTPTKAGYTFAGWYSDSSLSTSAGVAGASYTPDGDITLYAKWNPLSYSITYVLDGGTATGSNPTTYTPDTADITLSNPQKTGYDFSGWTLSIASGGAFASGSVTSGTTAKIAKGSYGNVTATATWNLSTYTVTFNANGHGTDPEAYTGVVYGSTISAPTNPTADGYTFAGWYKEAACTNAWNFSTDTITGVTTIYAKWTPTNYTITYTLNGGTATGSNPTTYNVETATFTLSNPTKAYYEFTGWTGSNGTTPQTSVSIAQGSTGNKSYTANWKLAAAAETLVADIGVVYLNVLANDISGATLSTELLNVPTGVTATVENNKIKFASNSMNSVISIGYTISYGGETATATVKIIPATSVYYEETSGFVTFNGKWENDGTAATAIAEARTPGSATYGDLGGIYDDTNSSTFSMGSAKKYTVSMSNINRNGDGYAAFTFTGTGFEVYSVTNNDCGYFEIDVTGTKTNDAGEKLVDLALFDNNYYGYSYGKLYLKDGKITHDSTGTPLYKTTADDKSAGTIPFEDGRLTTNKPSGASQASGWTPVNNTETTEGLYQIPVISVKNLDYDTYTVKITPKYSPVQDMLYRQGSTDYSFWFDSVRIIDPIDPDSITEGSDIYNAYFEDRELNAGSQKIRNILIDKKNAGEVSGEGIGFFTVFDGSNAEAPGVIGTMADIAEYKEVGPNNEVYLEPGKAIGFNITTGSNVIPTKVSVGVKMIKSGISGILTVNYSQEINVSIPTELYREITGIEWIMSGDVYTTKDPIIIKNDSDSGVIISLTDIRWSYGKSNVAPAKAPIRFTFDPALVNAYMLQAAEADAIAEQTVEYEGVNIEWNKSEVELGETASLVITTPEEIIKVTVDGEEISNFEILEDGSKRWTYTVDAAALGGVEYDVVLYDKNGYNSKSLPTGVCKVVEPKVDIGDAVITWDKSEIPLGETATLSVETNEKIAAVIIGDERVTDFSLEDGRKTFALDITPDELGKYKYTVILEEYHGYTSTSVKSDALTVIGYTVSTDDIDIQWKSGTVETGAEAELIIRTPADIAKVIVDGHELTAFETLESGEKQWTYAITVEKTGELEYSIRFIDENGMESSSVSSGVLKVELPQEDPDDDENLTFWQKLIRFFRNLFSKIITFVKGLVK